MPIQFAQSIVVICACAGIRQNASCLLTSCGFRTWRMILEEGASMHTNAPVCCCRTTEPHNAQELHVFLTQGRLWSLSELRMLWLLLWFANSVTHLRSYLRFLFQLFCLKLQLQKPFRKPSASRESHVYIPFHAYRNIETILRKHVEHSTFDLTDLSLAKPVSTFCSIYWELKVKCRPCCVQTKEIQVSHVFEERIQLCSPNIQRTNWKTKAQNPYSDQNRENVLLTSGRGNTWSSEATTERHLDSVCYFRSINCMGGHQS